MGACFLLVEKINHVQKLLKMHAFFEMFLKCVPFLKM